MEEGVSLGKELTKAESQALPRGLFVGASHGPFLVTFKDLLKDQGKLRSRRRDRLRGVFTPTLEREKALGGRGAWWVLPE